MRKSPDNRRAMPFEEWPERNRLAWLAAIAPGDDDLLAVDRPALRWRRAPRRSVFATMGFGWRG